MTVRFRRYPHESPLETQQTFVLSTYPAQRERLRAETNRNQWLRRETRDLADWLVDQLHRATAWICMPKGFTAAEWGGGGPVLGESRGLSRLSQGHFRCLVGKVSAGDHFWPGPQPKEWGSDQETGCGAAWLARLTGGQEVPGSNPGSPTEWVELLAELNSHPIVSGSAGSTRSEPAPTTKGCRGVDLNFGQELTSLFPSLPLVPGRKMPACYSECRPPLHRRRSNC